MGNKKSIVFISYSSKDKSKVAKISKLLKYFNVNAFRDEEDIQAGEKWKLIIEKKLKNCQISFGLLEQKCS